MTYINPTIVELEEQERMAWSAGDTKTAGLLARIIELEQELDTMQQEIDNLEDRETLEDWERNNGPAETYKQFFADCFEWLSSYYPCPSVTSDHDRQVIFAAIARGEEVKE